MTPQRTIVVVDYDPAWTEIFEEEAARLRGVFGDLLTGLHHIGSTSIPGMAAKPVVDMMPLVRSIDAVDELDAPMVALGYQPRGEFGIAGRRFFPKSIDGIRAFNVHVFAHDDPGAARHLAFRDYMRAHPDAAADYAALKREGARLHPHDIEGYMEHKDEFIKKFEAIALRWWQG